MAALLNSNQASFRTHLLESHIRTALEMGELSPAMEAQIQGFAAQANLTDRDQKLLRVLQDAIEDGCIQRVGRR